MSPTTYCALGILAGLSVAYAGFRALEWAEERWGVSIDPGPIGEKQQPS